MSSRNSRVVSLTALVLVIAGTAVPLAAQISGAVYTAKSDGIQQNPNIFQSKQEVYFRAQKVPDGTYYFQVTNPSGALLLSSDDAACRQVVVSGGGFSQVIGPCPHQFVSLSGGGVVQLYPYDTTDNNGGEYKAWLISQAPACGVSVNPLNPKELLGVTAACSKTDNYKVLDDCQVDCGPPGPSSLVGGRKYYDLDTNGARGGGEPGVAGFRIDVYVNGSLTPMTQFTVADGGWFVRLGEGSQFRACEVLPIGAWVQTGPIPGATSGPATADQTRCWTGTVGEADIDGLDFGNVCLGAGGGRTLGFWSNKNGQAILKDNDPAWRYLLNGGVTPNPYLRSANGSYYTVPAGNAGYSNFRDWLLGADAVNMSYMLSAQLAAMELNVAFGGVSGGALILAGTKPPACSLPVVNQAGFIAVSPLMIEAIAELRADGYTPAGDPERTCQEFKKNALDNANNNQNFVKLLPPCPVTY